MTAKEPKDQLEKLFPYYVKNRSRATDDESERLKACLSNLKSEYIYDAILNFTNSDGNTVLHCAVILEDEAVSGQILNSLKPTDRVRALELGNDCGQTPIGLAVSKGSSSLIKSMLECADPKHWLQILQMQDHDDKAAIHSAAISNSNETLNLILDSLVQRAIDSHLKKEGAAL